MIQTYVHIGSLAELRPTVNFANCMTALPGQEWGPRIIPDCQLIYIISGRATLWLGCEQYNLFPGDGVFYGANSPHQFVSSATDTATFSSIHFNWNNPSAEPVHPTSGIRDCTAIELSQPAQSYTLAVDTHGDVHFPHYFALANAEGLFLQIVREYRNEEYGYAAVLRGLLMQLLATVIRQQISDSHSSAHRRKIAPALEAIRKQPQIVWTNMQLAHVCGYHPTYFAALFKEITGHSPTHYLILERVRKAKELLLGGGTVEAIADQLGYSSTHYFCRNFKTVTGFTPTEFRKQMIEL